MTLFGHHTEAPHEATASGGVYIYLDNVSLKVLLLSDKPLLAGPHRAFAWDGDTSPSPPDEDARVHFRRLSDAILQFGHFKTHADKNPIRIRQSYISVYRIDILDDAIDDALASILAAIADNQGWQYTPVFGEIATYTEFLQLTEDYPGRWELDIR